MVEISYARRMARYNRWQNDNLYTVADGLSDGERRRDRGAFFGSIHGTLNHLLWADRMWMSRFSDWPRPGCGIGESPTLVPDWSELKRERRAADARLIEWADGLDPDWIKADLTWFSGATGSNLTKPRWQLVMHLFNHQSHHRGQVHVMLTQAGGKPRETDLFIMPE